mgnify:CR=1 FL=1
MLVLPRKKFESIIINDNIEIMVIEVLKDRVRLGVEAPKEVDFVRAEYHKDNMKKYEIFKEFLRSGNYEESEKVLSSLPSNSLYPTSDELKRLEDGLKEYN